MNYHDDLREVLAEMQRRKDKIICEQLGELVEKGLLVVVETQPIIFRDASQPGYKLRVEQAVKLRLRDHERFAEMEAEINRLRDERDKANASLVALCKERGLL